MMVLDVHLQRVEWPGFRGLNGLSPSIWHCRQMGDPEAKRGGSDAAAHQALDDALATGDIELRFGQSEGSAGAGGAACSMRIQVPTVLRVHRVMLHLASPGVLGPMLDNMEVDYVAVSTIRLRKVTPPVHARRSPSLHYPMSA